ncbi:hypothetical protein E4T56_gene8763 [Termitomyces sp. T112]|nr:hypothetical protein E4T56_gene8763 [Termitomyces sp. T112]
MIDCKAIATPLKPGICLFKSNAPCSPEEVEEMKKIPYIQATGALLYLAMCMCPNIVHAVSVLCCFNACLGPKHWRSVKHLMYYVHGTLNYKIEYLAGSTSLPFVAYADADHGSNPNNGRSTTGSVLMVAGRAVSWMSKLQTIVALSTTEAEFVAASETGQELCWLRNFLADIGAPQSTPLIMNVDNQSAISVSKQPEDMVYDGKIKPVYIPSEDMVADLLTKTLARDVVDKLRRKMGVIGEFSQEDLQ